MTTGTRVWTLNPSLYNGENEVGPDSRHVLYCIYIVRKNVDFRGEKRVMVHTASPTLS